MRRAEATNCSRRRRKFMKMKGRKMSRWTHCPASNSRRRHLGFLNKISKACSICSLRRKVGSRRGLNSRDRKCKSTIKFRKVNTIPRPCLKTLSLGSKNTTTTISSRTAAKTNFTKLVGRQKASESPKCTSKLQTYRHQGSPHLTVAQSTTESKHPPPRRRARE